MNTQLEQQSRNNNMVTQKSSKSDRRIQKDIDAEIEKAKIKLNIQEGADSPSENDLESKEEDNQSNVVSIRQIEGQDI